MSKSHDSFVRWLRAMIGIAALALWLRTTLAQEVPPPAPESLSRDPAPNLSPLYEIVGAECQRLLVSKKRWQVLPRPINDLLVSPEQAPCFEMQNESMVYKPELVRSLAERTWDGNFRLLYNSVALAQSGDEIWLTISNLGSPLEHFSNDKWMSYTLPRAAQFERRRRAAYLAKDARGSWWIATQDGLHQLIDGQWERPEISSWRGWGAGGIVGDVRGRLAVWTERVDEMTATVAFFAEGKWSTADAQRTGRWTNAGIRPDGCAVLAGKSQLTIVRPPEPTKLGTNNSPSAAEPSVSSQTGQWLLDDDNWVAIADVPVVSAGGSALFAATRLRDEQTGLVRVSSDGNTRWIDFACKPPLQISPYREDGFLILEGTQGLFLLPKDSPLPERLATVGEVRATDVLIGSDRQGRVYIKRDRAVLMLCPEFEAPPAVDTQQIADLHRGRRAILPFNIPAVVDGKGRCWFVRPDRGDVWMQPVGVDRRLMPDFRFVGVRSLWPGVSGEMLILFDDGRAALMDAEDRVELAGSLVELGVRHFPATLEAAPRQSREERRELVGVSPWRPRAAPWLRVGNDLWVSDEQAVYRVSSAAGESEPQLRKVCDGAFQLIGPLRSGQLLLVRDVPASSPNLATWRWVEDPAENPVCKMIEQAPPNNRPGGLSNPGKIRAAPWHLDRQGYLWLRPALDRSFRIDSVGTWTLLDEIGEAQFEYPEGFVWSYYQAYVYPGYEIAGPGLRRSCLPSYLEHLTPLFAERDRVYCLTPDGIALLQFDLRNPGRDGVLQRIPVRWMDTPAAYIGRSGLRLFFITGEISNGVLVAADLSQVGN